MDTILSKAISTVQNSIVSYCKFISSNDCGKTGAHQKGFYIGKSYLPHIFEQEILKDNDYTKFVTVKWQSDFETESRFKYYGSKNECHFTRFKRGFPYLTDDSLGNLLIICKISASYYEAFVLEKDEEIEDFFTELNISPTQTDGVIQKQFELTSENKVVLCFQNFINSLEINFPSTYDLAQKARMCFNSSYNISHKEILNSPDKILLNWIDTEFQLFKTLEINRYSSIIQTKFKSVEELIDTANSILNRRKSRAGKSLEHHLNEVFSISGLTFESQANTEDKKKPDFLFPNSFSYLNPKFNDSKLVALACKTTCKDRWRQILNEADRVKTKHLFTLQQGISLNQLQEMHKYNVQLVVPKPYIKEFPRVFQPRILSLENFILHVKNKQLA